MPLPAPSGIVATPRTGRVDLLWPGVPGAASYNYYRWLQGSPPPAVGTTAPTFAGLAFNLWTDFGLPGGLTNGQAYRIALTTVDGTGAESALSTPLAVAPAAPSPVLYRFRQVLGDLLGYLVAHDGIPALNATLAADAGAGTPALSLAAPQIVRGDLLDYDQPTVMIGVQGESEDFQAMEGVFAGRFTSQIKLVLPNLGRGADGTPNEVSPEQVAYVGDAWADTIRDMLTSAANNRILPVSYKTGRWLLPGYTVFQDCMATRVLRLNTPVTAGDNVVRAPAWIVLHTATAFAALSRPRAVGG